MMQADALLLERGACVSGDGALIPTAVRRRRSRTSVSVSMTGFMPRKGSSLRRSRERSKFDAVRKICEMPLTSIEFPFFHQNDLQEMPLIGFFATSIYTGRAVKTKKSCRKNVGTKNKLRNPGRPVRCSIERIQSNSRLVLQQRHALWGKIQTFWPLGRCCRCEHAGTTVRPAQQSGCFRGGPMKSKTITWDQETGLRSRRSVVRPLRRAAVAILLLVVLSLSARGTQRLLRPPKPMLSSPRRAQYLFPGAR